MALLQKDYILLIMNCQKYRHKALIQKETWLQTIPDNIHYYHVIGDEELTSDFLFNDNERILWVNTRDDYISLPSKVIAAFGAIRQTFKFKYVFKTDDDQDLINDKFFDTIISVLNTQKLKSHYGGHVVDVQIPYLSRYFELHPELPQDMIIQKTQYCSGRFYFLSSEALSNLISKKESIANEYLEDYAVGLYLNPIFKKSIFSVASDTIFKDIIC